MRYRMTEQLKNAFEQTKETAQLDICGKQKLFSNTKNNSYNSFVFK